MCFSCITKHQYKPSVLLDTSTWTVTVPFSLAAKAAKPVACVLLPSLSTTWAVLACMTNELSEVLTIQYSPFPLNVYDLPSDVVRCGSPVPQSERKRMNRPLHKINLLL